MKDLVKEVVINSLNHVRVFYPPSVIGNSQGSALFDTDDVWGISRCHYQTGYYEFIASSLTSSSS